MKKIVFLVVLLMPSVLSATIVQIDYSGECLSYNLSGPHNSKYDFNLGDNIEIIIEYDTSLLSSFYDDGLTEPLDQYKAYGWESSSAISRYDISWSRNGSLVNSLNMSDFSHENILIEKLSFYYPNTQNPFSSDAFYISVSDIPKDINAYSAWGVSFALKLVDEQYEYVNDIVYPGKIPDKDYYPRKRLFYNGQYYESNEIIGGTVSVEFSVDYFDVNIIPEPCSMFLVAIGGIALLRRRRYVLCREWNI